ncbi:RICIN domain-containing protein [Microbulbifer sp. 2205BS26-8]|uniref:RICIN domain-containing protein n=1 Tax=Microbulbifer sp. 2205BS26-8 TaxID=3064386 RepID=UPI00273F7090|nr:RICIN domain-containing protein [Microbulbifer sp. 2205BS26-8]MDP5210797.1 RICIN domain-containing protein [Microbulbifer sp. 2205BS26-8]
MMNKREILSFLPHSSAAVAASILTGCMYAQESSASATLRFESKLSAKCIVAEGAAASNGTNVVQDSCGDSRDSITLVDLSVASYPNQYFLQLSGTSECLSVDDWSNADNANILLWQCSSTSSPSANQRWLLESPNESANSGFVYVKNASSGKHLTILNASAGDNASIVQYAKATTHDRDHQLWHVGAASELVADRLHAVSKWNDQCISVQNASVDNNADIVQRACSEDAADQALEMVSLAPYGLVDEYLIKPSNSKKCLTVENWAQSNGANIVLWECPAAPNASANQRWHIEASGNLFRLKNHHSAKYLSIDSWLTSENASLIQWDKPAQGDSDNQLWRFRPTNNAVNLVQGGSNFCIADSNSANNDVLRQSCNQPTGADWELIELSGAEAGLFKLKNAETNLCLKASASGASVAMKNGCDLADSGFKWKLDIQNFSTGQYRLESVATGQCLDYDGNTGTFAQFGCSETESQALALPKSVHTVDKSSIKVANFDGFGTSLAWGATITGKWASKRDTLVENLFSPTNGLGFNIARFLVSAGNHAPNSDCLVMRPGSPTDAAYVDVNGNIIPNAETAADEGQYYFYEKALKTYNIEHTEAFFSSPPHWMTINGCINGSDSGSAANIDEDTFDDFADYMATIAKWFENKELGFDTVAPMNEPNASWWSANGADHQGTALSETQQGALIEEVHAAFTAKGVNAKIAASEANHTNWTISNYNSYSQSQRDALYRINTHTYNWMEPANDHGTLASLQKLATTERKQLWVSEFGTGTGIVNDSAGNPAFGDHGDMATSLSIAKRITDDLNYLRPNGWVYWDAIEDKDRTDEGNNSWGLILASYSDENTPLLYSRAYYGMMQYSRHLKPGSGIIDSGHSKSVASFDSENDTLTIVSYNDGSTEKSVTFDLSGFGYANENGFTVTRFRTSKTEQHAQLGAASISAGNSDTLVETLPAASITTMVISPQ